MLFFFVICCSLLFSFWFCTRSIVELFLGFMFLVWIGIAAYLGWCDVLRFPRFNIFSPTYLYILFFYGGLLRCVCYVRWEEMLEFEEIVCLYFCVFFLYLIHAYIVFFFQVNMFFAIFFLLGWYILLIVFLFCVLRVSCEDAFVFSFCCLVLLVVLL